MYSKLSGLGDLQNFCFCLRGWGSERKENSGSGLTGTEKIK
jgi:hypothetical protein